MALDRYLGTTAPEKFY